MRSGQSTALFLSSFQQTSSQCFFINFTKGLANCALGYGLGNLFALIDPAPVAFVGSGATAFDILEPHIRAAIARTAGGLHPGAISFQTEPDELPVIREGCVIRALTFVDQEIFATGNQVDKDVA